MDPAISLRPGSFPTELKVNLTKIYWLNFEVKLQIKRKKHGQMKMEWTKMKIKGSG